MILPNYFDLICCELTIFTYDGQFLCDCLSDHETVKGVSMVKRQAGYKIQSFKVNR